MLSAVQLDNIEIVVLHGLIIEAATKTYRACSGYDAFLEVGGGHKRNITQRKRFNDSDVVAVGGDREASDNR